MRKKSNIFNFLFFFSYLLISIYYAFQKVDYFGEIFLFVYHYVLPLLLLFIIVFQKSCYETKIFFRIIILEVLCLLSYLISKNAEIFFTFSFINIASNIDFKKFIKFDLFLKIGLIIVVFFLYKIGIAHDVTLYREDGFLRHSYGFFHPNVLGAMFLIIGADLFYLFNSNNKNKFVLFIFLSLIFLLCYFICDSRSSELGILILIMLTFFSSYLKNMMKKNNIQKLLIFLPILMLLFSLISVFLYKQNFSIAIKLNDLFSNRIKHANSFISYYGVNLFGHYFEYYGRLDQYYYISVLDNGYINILIQFGVVMCFVMIYIYMSIIKKSLKNYDYGIFGLIILLSLYGLMEHYIFVIIYSPILISYSKILYLGGKNEI